MRVFSKLGSYVFTQLCISKVNLTNLELRRFVKVPHGVDVGARGQAPAALPAAQSLVGAVDVLPARARRPVAEM